MKTNDRAGSLRNLSRRGIRSRVYLYLMLFGVALVVLLWLFQIVFLDSIYRGQRTGQVIRSGEQIARAGDTESMRTLARRLAASNDFSFRLLDGDLHDLLSENGTRYSMIHRFTEQQLREWCEAAAKAGKAVTGEFETSLVLAVDNPSGIRPDFAPEPPEEAASPAPPQEGSEGRNRNRQFPGARFLGFGSGQPETAAIFIYAAPVTLDDGTACTLLLCTQITPLASTLDALRFELIIITGVVLIGMLALAYVISRRVSQPIIETNAAARSLARASYARPKHADAYREIAELNTTLEKAADELGQVDRLQHELIANISHDLRTPLTMIGGYAEAMRDIPDENTPENMQIIIDETARLSTLVNELLDFSRMQTGSVTMNPAPFDLTEEVAMIAARVGKLTGKDGYRIVFEPAEHLTVVADANRIGQVIYNLLGNALTYTGADKTVTVTQSVHGSRARIAIADSGKGIPEEELPLIWNRYYRTKETHRRAIIGSGLGLNIVRTILEQHRTPYGVDSEVGKGTVFWFELETVKEA